MTHYDEYDNEHESKKSFWISTLISFLITGVICGLLILYQVFGRSYTFDKDALHILVEALTLSGGLVLCFYLLTLVTKKGVFDALVYGVKLAWFNTFYRNIRKTKLARTYREYREEKNRGRQRSMLFIALGASPYFVAGLILLIPFLSSIY